ncbi:hypothetical protein PHYSODRAFT_294402 [Phytophthora sojae]|uniref:Uncharacterized protein n=1 Tax=Phytophthora sojae (strain P6497) TaxID=1094619 RepID=G4YHI8_PHYSP|nr:hypothetical protein PHYSODRAFT_294402 [Phytophthora sojae]EGZ29093.1 hypothetical protein PHYSODRAFT_294402 [Phytophthora sojae]|eukprot:XP_009516368.1 hypothetical protein PHYSODRAFT_294402 [Phytophthora sojae]
MCIIEAVTSEVPFPLVDPTRGYGATPEKPDEMNEKAWEMVLDIIDEDPLNRLHFHEVIGKLKAFVAKATSEALNAAGQTSPSVSNDTTVPDLIAGPRVQDQALLFLLLACMYPGKRKTIVEANGVPAFIQLVKNGLSHYTKLCSLRCLYKLTKLASSLEDTTLSELKGTVRGTTLEECGSLSRRLSDDEDEDKLPAVALLSAGRTLANGQGRTKGAIVLGVESPSKNSKSDVVIAAIPSLVSSESRSRRLYSDWELGNAAFDSDANRDAIVDAEAIPDLIKLLRSGASELQAGCIKFKSQAKSDFRCSLLVFRMDLKMRRRTPRECWLIQRLANVFGASSLSGHAPFGYASSR